MKDKPSEWVAISDLMSGVIAVVMLLLVVSVLQKSATELKQKMEASRGYDAKREAVLNVLHGIKAGFMRSGESGLVAFDMDSLKMTLPDKLFARGSACISADERARFVPVSNAIKKLLENYPEITIFVDGHTDNVSVSRPVLDYRKYCTVYDDNYTLSAARAREVRSLVAVNFPIDFLRRIIVAGYGDSRPLPSVAPDDAANRRVEIRLSIEKSEVQ